MLLVEFINVVAKNMESYRAETEKGVTDFWTIYGQSLMQIKMVSLMHLKLNK